MRLPWRSRGRAAKLDLLLSLRLLGGDPWGHPAEGTDARDQPQGPGEGTNARVSLRRSSIDARQRRLGARDPVSCDTRVIVERNCYGANEPLDVAVSLGRLPRAAASLRGLRRALQRPDAAGRKRLGSLVVSAIASILPLWTLVLVLRVFVIGGSSHVVQLAGGTYDLFGLWVKWWPNLFFGNMLAFPLFLGAACFQPYPRAIGRRLRVESAPRRKLLRPQRRGDVCSGCVRLPPERVTASRRLACPASFSGRGVWTCCWG